jgi:cellulose synthase/poly-beta-1,6-N-acetylglucosamine synthase-like glycosyltransferase
VITLLLVSLFVVLYTYAGYPLLVGLYAKLFPSRVRGRSDFEPKVSVCLAVFDGEAHIARKIRSLQALDYPADKLELLLFSDGSTDRTELIVREFSVGDPRIVLLSSATRVGKPTALNRLARIATGEVLLLCDARQSLSRNALRALLHPLADPSVGCVSGSLVLAGPTGAGMYWRYERFIRGAEGRMGGMVGVSGSIYATRRVDMPELPGDILLDDMFVPLQVALATRKRTVLAESAEAFDVACDDEHEFVRKVRTLAGNYQLLARMPRLLAPGLNPVWFQLVSHKLMRLVCPWALLVLLFASGTLAYSTESAPAAIPWWRALFLGQVAFYTLSLLGPRAGSAGALARTFVVLNAAAVAGLWRFMSRSQTVTW